MTLLNIPQGLWISGARTVSAARLLWPQRNHRGQKKSSHRGEHEKLHVFFVFSIAFLPKLTVFSSCWSCTQTWSTWAESWVDEPGFLRIYCSAKEPERGLPDPLRSSQALTERSVCIDNFKGTIMGTILSMWRCASWFLSTHPCWMNAQSRWR